MSSATLTQAHQPEYFNTVLERHGHAPLRREKITTFQVNVGKLCNQACHHCHVDAGPKRPEIMTAETARRVLDVLAASTSVETVDITGGAPELNPSFKELVNEARKLGHEVIDRCNLTVLLEPGREDLGEFLAANRVHIIASLPCYTAENVDKQRGNGVFGKSIEALQRLNALGFGVEGSELELDLVYNPLGPSLPPPQAKLEADYKQQLGQRGMSFNRLLTITNMPISRFGTGLRKADQFDPYLAMLAASFNPRTVQGVMCRALVSVGWDGTLYDCDFNQMLDLGLGVVRTIWDLESLDELEGSGIRTGSHCFGCTAGAGSSCVGVLRERY